MRRRLVLLFLLAMWTIPVSGQQKTPVISSEDIFTDAVEVVETLPIVQGDNANRWLYYFDPTITRWKYFKYPDEVKKVDESYRSLKKRSDLTYFLDYWEEYPRNSRAWIFNPVQNSIYPAETECGVVKDLPGEGRWLVYRNPQDHFLYFCFTENGKLTTILPDTLQRLLSENTDPRDKPVTSPDGKWIIFSVYLRGECELCYRYHLYSYEIATGNLNYIGVADRAEHVRLDFWVDNLTLVLHAFSFASYEYEYLYLANVTEANSLKFLTSYQSALPYEASAPLYFDHPKRLIWNKGTVPPNTFMPRVTSVVVEYNLEINQANTIASVGCINYLARCTVIPNNVIDYDAGQATLVAVLEFDPIYNTGNILRVYHIPDSQLVYEREMEGSGYWITKNSFLAVGRIRGDNNNSYDDNARYYKGYILTVTDGRVSETPLDNAPVSENPLSPNKNHILVWTQPENQHAVSVYNTLDKQLTPIIKALNYRNYIVQLEWTENNLLLVTLKGGVISYEFILGRWLIRIAA